MAVKKPGYVPKKRNAHTRERKKVMLLATEGKNKTETLYFRSVPSDYYSVQFARGNYTDPVNMVVELKKAFKEMELDPSEGDVAFCLVDADVDPGKDRKLELADAQAKGPICLIVSVPCFEVWFICHYAASTRQYASNAEVIDALKKYIPGYTKDSDRIFDILGDKTPVAIENAIRLEKHCLENGLRPHSTEFLPSTEVYRILELLREFRFAE